MKKIIVLFLSAFLVISSTQAQTETMKLGYINSSELLSMMPELRKADTTLQKLARELEKEEQELYRELENKLNKFRAEEANMMESIRQVRVNELNDLQMRFQRFQEVAQQDLRREKEKLYSPIIEKAEKAINKVAKENGYRFVFDSSMGAILYADDVDNILPLVKAELGIQ